MKRNGNAERRRRENRGAEGGERGAAGAEVEHRRREDRGAEGAEGVGCGEGVSPPHRGEGWGGGCAPSAEKNFDFGSQYGEFWCILDGFFTLQLPVLHAKPEFNHYMRIKAMMVSR